MALDWRLHFTRTDAERYLVSTQPAPFSIAKPLISHLSTEPPFSIPVDYEQHKLADRRTRVYRRGQMRDEKSERSEGNRVRMQVREQRRSYHKACCLAPAKATAAHCMDDDTLIRQVSDHNRLEKLWKEL